MLCGTKISKPAPYSQRLKALSQKSKRRQPARLLLSPTSVIPQMPRYFHPLKRDFII
jgi:hypothetical protein